MKILKDKGTFEILTPKEELQRQLHRIVGAGRVCYQSNKTSPKEDEYFIRSLLRRGHESVIEHSNMTVRFDNVSRGFTHELVRHRLVAYSQESTRYVDYAKEGEEADLDKFQLKCVVPPHQDEHEEIVCHPQKTTNYVLSLEEMFLVIESFYRGLRKAGWPPEDARQILPIGIKSQIVVSANLREWRHIFHLRTALAAHWEIRNVMCLLLDQVKAFIPVIFEDFVEAGVDRKGIRYFEKISK